MLQYYASKEIHTRLAQAALLALQTLEHEIYRFARWNTYG